MQDPRDPNTKEADSMCGHPVPGVNVYDWGLDKKIKHSHALRKLDKGSKSWYKVSPPKFVLPAKNCPISPWFI